MSFRDEGRFVGDKPLTYGEELAAHQSALMDTFEQSVKENGFEKTIMDFSLQFPTT